ncbi:MAG: hypothetical protein H7301_02690 [Cryobacterium sp.]|nr:hypothetical protein [Oligoflexia bacterium]
MNFPVPAFIQDAEFVDGIIEGTLEVEPGVLDAFFDSESEDPTEEDFRAVFGNAERFCKVFNRAFHQSITRGAAEDITNESFEDSLEEPAEKDYALLAADLILKAAQFFPDATLLIYESPRIFPKEEIVAELNAEFELAEAYFD